MSVLAALLLFAACTGAGAQTLRGLGLFSNRNAVERFGLAFAVGLGTVGWLMFWPGIAGWFRPVLLWPMLCVLALGNLAFRDAPTATEATAGNHRVLSLALIALAVLALAFDLAEGTAPPVDGDTLAYHFDRARTFAEGGRIDFQPIAISGAAPLLIHLSYGAAYALGGETAMTLWTLASGWMGAVLLFGFLRRWLPVHWAGAGALLYQTLPAMVYGAGSGQVEARLALFVLAAFIGLADGWRERGERNAVLVGLGVGFYAASKMTGLLMIAAVAPLIAAPAGGRVRRVVLFGAAAAVAGCQWYFWNIAHTGDPLFPLLFPLVERAGLANPAYWDASHHAFFKGALAARADLISSFWTKLFYPLIATFRPPELIESGRVGLGPFFALAAPLAAVGVWLQRGRLRTHALFPVMLAVLFFYVLWLNFGGIPKVRHLLPVVPGLMACLLVAAHAFATRFGAKAAFAALALSLILQLGVLGIFSKTYAAYHFGGTDRDAFLADNVRGYAGAKALNALADVGRVYVWERQLTYYLKPPSFFAAPFDQVTIDGRPGYVTPGRFYRQLRAAGITHLLVQEYSGDMKTKDVGLAIVGLAEAGCLAKVETVPVRFFASRTLKTMNTRDLDMLIWRVQDACPLPAETKAGHAPG